MTKAAIAFAAAVSPPPELVQPVAQPQEAVLAVASLQLRLPNLVCKAELERRRNASFIESTFQTYQSLSYNVPMAMASPRLG